MRDSRLAALVFRNLQRSKNHFLAASVGIVVGIATFAFFLALGLGVRDVVLGKIFPLDQLEIVPKSLDVDVGPLRLGVSHDAIDDEKVAELEEIEGVARAYPKMRLTVPTIGVGGEEILGSDLRSELVADGINPDLVKADIGRGFRFADLDSEKEPVSCTSDADCGEDMYCGNPVGALVPREGGTPGGIEQVCRNYIPVLASEHVVELYNGALRRAHGFPKINPDAVLGFTFDLTFGASMVGASNRDQVIEAKARLVGFSRKAIALGITMPIEYVQRLNVAFDNEEAATRFHSVILMVPEKDNVASVAKAVEDMGLAVADTGAEEAALLISIFMLIFGLVSAIIVGIAAVNITHVFFMLVYERQHEIGIMRAVGASRGDIARIVLGEAAVLGLVAGVVGILLAFAAGEVFDLVSAQYVPDFPYKPTTYFRFPWWLLLSSLGFSVGFCVLGAALPARRAARMEPAHVLSGH